LEYRENSLVQQQIGVFLQPLIDKHEAIEILGLTFVTQGLDGEAIVPRGLIDIDSAGLHGRPSQGTETAGLVFRLCAFNTPAAGAGKKREGFVIPLFKHLAFKFYESVQESLSRLSPINAPLLRSSVVKQNGSPVTRENLPGLLRGRRLGRAAVFSSVHLAAVLALEANPGRGDHAGRINDFGLSRPALDRLSPVLIQFTSLHVVPLHRSPPYPSERCGSRAGEP
jgi:hypothetical protein